MSSKHAILSASSSHKWLSCTPSARLELDFENTTSEAALEGTAAHNLCEHKLKKALKMRSKKPVSSYDCDEMDEHTDGYVGYVLEVLAEVKATCKDPLVLIEERLDFSSYVPDGFGTGDCVIVADDTLHIIDFKYGQGVLVDSYKNPQMMLYALGALSKFDSLYDIEKVKMHIYQPRRSNISTFEMTSPDLLDWAENTLTPRAELAFNGDGEFNCGEWCRFCRAKVKCRKRAEENLSLAKLEFALPPILTDGDIENILPILDDLSKWADDIFSYAQSLAIEKGKQWSGFKVVEGRSNRKYADENKVISVANENGYTDIFKKSLITLTEMEKLMGKKEFNNILGDLVVKPQGKLVLVPISDKRQEVEITNINDEFQEEKGE